MTPQQQILKLYEQWGTLTLLEGEAIRAADWTRVAQCQADKWSLRTQIQEQAIQLESEIKAGLADPDGLHKQIHHRVDILIEWEMENERALTEQRRHAEVEQWELQRSTRTLRRIQHAYAPAFEPAWDSYS